MNKIIYRSIKVPLAVCFVILAIAQILLRIPFVGGSLPVSGVASYETQQSNTGKILIELLQAYQPSGNIKVLVNGSEAAALSSRTVELTVMNNSVIEIDGRKVDYPFEVKVAPQDANATCEGDYAQVDGNIVKLSRIFIDKNN